MQVHCSEKMDGFCVFCKSATDSRSADLTPEQAERKQYSMMLISKHGKEYTTYENVKRELGCVLFDYLNGMTVAAELVFEETAEKKIMTRQNKFNLLRNIVSSKQQKYTDAWTEKGMEFTKNPHKTWGRLKLVIFDVLQAQDSLANMSYVDRLHYVRNIVNGRKETLQENEEDLSQPDNTHFMAVEVVEPIHVQTVQDIHELANTMYGRNAEGIVVNIYNRKNNHESQTKLKKLLDVDAIVTRLNVSTASEPAETGWSSKQEIHHSFKYVIVNTVQSKHLIRDSQGQCKGDIMRIPWRGHLGLELNKIIQLRTTLWHNEPEYEDKIEPKHIRHVWVKPAGDAVEPVAKRPRLDERLHPFFVQLSLADNSD